MPVNWIILWLAGLLYILYPNAPQVPGTPPGIDRIAVHYVAQ